MPINVLKRLWPLKPRNSVQPRLRVLMVCTGNICRSPTAEAVLRERLRQHDLGHVVEVDSAGTHAHQGSAPDARSQKQAQLRGYDLSSLRGRQLDLKDFERFDLILGMDQGHLDWMRHYAAADAKAEQALLSRHASRFADAGEIPDPYFGSPEGFALVLAMIEDAVDGWLPVLKARVQVMDE